MQLRYVICREFYPCLLYSIVFVVMPSCITMPTILRLIRFYVQFKVSKMKSQQLTHLDRLTASAPMSEEFDTTKGDSLDLSSRWRSPNKKNTTNSSQHHKPTPSISAKRIPREHDFECNNNFMQQYKIGCKERIWYRMNALLSRHSFILTVLFTVLGIHVVLWFCIAVMENSFFFTRSIFHD